MTNPRDMISDKDWEVLKEMFPKRTRSGNGREFLEAVLFKARTGIPWRDLPERFGPWGTQYKRFARWARAGFFGEILSVLQEKVGVDLRQAHIDATSVKIHKSGSGSKKKLHKR